MIKKISIILILIFSHYCVANSSEAPLPKILGYDDNNVPVSLEPNKPAIIALWASWCPYCKKSTQYLEHIQSKVGTEKIQVFIINTKENGSNREQKKLFRKFAKSFEKQGLTSQFIFDKNQKFYRITGKLGLPTILLVDKNGNIITQIVGFGEQTGNTLIEATNKLITAD